MGIDVASSRQLTLPTDPDAESAVDAEDVDVLPAAAGTELDAGDPPAGVPGPTQPRPGPPLRRAAVFGLIAIIALSALVGWLGLRDHQSHQAQSEHGQFLQAARQGALNLTTIDWQHADADVHRIMDDATGDFSNEFSNRAQPFIDVVKQAQSTSVGTVIDAGLESQTADAAQALVAVSVKTATPAAAPQDPRTWRMRISVQKIDDQIKVSNVEFVP